MNQLQHYYKTELDRLCNQLIPDGLKNKYVVIRDHIGESTNIQGDLLRARSQMDNDSRLIITSLNFIWQPLVILAEHLKIKRPQPQQSWLSTNDIHNLLYLSNLELVTSGTHILLPVPIPYLSKFVNTYIARLPLIRHLCLVQYYVARKIPNTNPDTDYTVSIIVPARNEAGTIEDVVKRTPHLGIGTEIIFIEGGSKDNTWAEIQRVAKKYGHIKNIRYYKAKIDTKGDKVRQGFSLAKNDILMILDSDLSTAPEELPAFYQALRTRKADFVMGSRLIYPQEHQAMRFLNILGNKFFGVSFSWLLNQNIKDTLCGTKCLFKYNYNVIVKNRSYFGNFDPFGDFDLIFGSAKANLKILEIPVHYKARVYGKTNISRFKHGWLLLKMNVFAAKKLKFF